MLPCAFHGYLFFLHGATATVESCTKMVSCVLGVTTWELVMVLSLLAVTLIPLFASCMLFVLTALDRSRKFRRYAAPTAHWSIDWVNGRFPKAIGRYRLSRLGTLLVHLSVVALWMLLLLYSTGPAMLFVIFKFDFGGVLSILSRTVGAEGTEGLHTGGAVMVCCRCSRSLQRFNVRSA